MELVGLPVRCRGARMGAVGAEKEAMAKMTNAPKMIDCERKELNVVGV